MLILRTDKRSYLSDENVQITLLLRNDQARTAEYHFPTAQRFDIVVEREGQKVWQWSDGRHFAQVLTTLLIAPGDSRVFKAEWDQRDFRGQKVPPGHYRMRAWVSGTADQAERDLVIGEAEIAAAREREIERERYYQMLALHGYPVLNPAWIPPARMLTELE